LKPLKACLLIASLLFSAFLPTLISESVASYATEPKIAVFLEDDGVRVVFNDVHLYFNASNGGEITEYYDLLVDPGRSRNLVNLNWNPWNNLLPLFASLFYRPHIYPEQFFSTGGDSNAMLRLISNTSQYVILQASSRIMSRFGQVAKDAYGNVIYVNSTWIIRDDSLVSVERTFFLPTYATVPSGWRWYPFYLTRRAGFGSDATFYLFNTTYAYSSVVNEATYRNFFDFYPVLPNDNKGVFGVAAPFYNTSIGGDGTHNILVAYKYNEFIGVDEWRSDNYHSDTNAITEAGPVYEFREAKNFYTHVYHALVNFTHQPVNDKTLQDFASYYADHPSVALLMECSVTSNKDLYTPGDYIAFFGSGISYYNLTGLMAKFLVTNSLNRVVYQQNYGPGNIVAGQTFNVTLLAGTVQPFPDDYTLSFQIFSQAGIMLTSNSKVITVEP